jgi:predicted small secreted protein
MNLKHPLLPAFFVVVFLFAFINASSQDKNWTHFRGSNLNGIAATENVPLKLDSTNIKWKTKIHDEGYSSPVVYDNQIWVTSAKPDGKELYAVCIDFQTGKIIYDIKVFTPDKVEGKALYKYLCLFHSMYRKRICICSLWQQWHSLYKYCKRCDSLETHRSEM